LFRKKIGKVQSVIFKLFDCLFSKNHNTTLEQD
jgi:hypothetical protein